MNIGLLEEELIKEDFEQDRVRALNLSEIRREQLLEVLDFLQYDITTERIQSWLDLELDMRVLREALLENRKEMVSVGNRN